MHPTQMYLCKSGTWHCMAEWCRTCTALQSGVGPDLAWPVNQRRTLERMEEGEGQRKYLDCFGPQP